MALPTDLRPCQDTELNHDSQKGNHAICAPFIGGNTIFFSHTLMFACCRALHVCSCVACARSCLPSAGSHALRFIHAVACILVCLSKLAMHHVPHGLFGFLFKGIWIISGLVQFLRRYEHSYTRFFVNTLFLLKNGIVGSHESCMFEFLK